MKEGEQTKHTKIDLHFVQLGSLLKPLEKEDSLKTKEINVVAKISAAGRCQK